MGEPSQHYGRAFSDRWKSLLDTLEEPSQLYGRAFSTQWNKDPSQHYGRAFPTLWKSLLNTMDEPSQHYEIAFPTLSKSLLYTVEEPSIKNTMGDPSQHLCGLLKESWLQHWRFLSTYLRSLLRDPFQQHGWVLALSSQRAFHDNAYYSAVWRSLHVGMLSCNQTLCYNDCFGS